MESNYKTIFINVSPVGKGMKFKKSVNGDQLARDIQASIEEMEQKGFLLFKSTPISSYNVSGYSATEGVMLIYKK